MSSLLPPTSRPRIHSVSTGVRPPLSISTLARSPANSFCVKDLPDAASSHKYSSSDSCASPFKPSSPSSPIFILPPLPDLKVHAGPARAGYRNMFPVLVSRTVQLWRTVRGGDDKHGTNFLSSPGSSPRSSTETEYILPLSASPQKTAFDIADLDTTPRPGALYRLTAFPSAHASLLLVVMLLPISSAVVLFCVSTLPVTFAWPRTLADLAQLGRDLSIYSRSGLGPTMHIISVLAVSAVWKHAWSIPGSVLWNVLAGALFHPFLATFLMTFLTCVGSVFATLLATPLAPVLTRIFPRPVELTRAALEGSAISSTSKSVQSENISAGASASATTGSTNSSPAWVRLSILRLVGIVPWSALNIACGLTGVALRDCIAGAFIGCLPWTAVTCQIGDVLQAINKAKLSSELGLGEGLSKSVTVSSVLAQPSMILELVFLTVLSLAPILFRDRLRKLIPSSDKVTVEVCEVDVTEGKELSVCSSQRDGPNERDALTGEGDEIGPNVELLGRGRRLRRQRWTWQRLSASIPRWSALNSPLWSSFPKIERDA